MNALRQLELDNEIYIDNIGNELDKAYNEYVIANEYAYTMNVYFKESNEDSLLATIGKGVLDIINKIAEFIENVKNAVLGNFHDKENEAKLKEIRKNRDKIDPNKKVKIRKGNDAEVLNQYVKELLILERQLLLIKSSPEISVGTNSVKKASNRNIEAMEILNKMKSLDEKYDKKLIEDNDDIIEMASKDAIRFSEKQLENVELDFDAILKNSKKVLKEFKTDAKGCKEPVKLNILQKMIRSLATKIRKATLLTASRHKKNLAAVLGLITLATASVAIPMAYQSNAGGFKDKVTSVKNKFIPSPEELEKRHQEALAELEKNRAIQAELEKQLAERNKKK